MTPTEAIALIDNIIAGVRLSRPEHARAQEAIGVLYKMVKDKEKAEDG